MIHSPFGMISIIWIKFHLPDPVPILIQDIHTCYYLISTIIIYIIRICIVAARIAFGIAHPVPHKLERIVLITICSNLFPADMHCKYVLWYGKSAKVCNCHMILHIIIFVAPVWMITRCREGKNNMCL